MTKVLKRSTCSRLTVSRLSGEGQNFISTNPDYSLLLFGFGFRKPIHTSIVRQQGKEK